VSSTRPIDEPTPGDRIALLAKRADAVARKAHKHKQSLTGNNFYANKLAELRAEATNAFRELSVLNVGDTSSLAELVQSCFSESATRETRSKAIRDLLFELSTTWKDHRKVTMAPPRYELFPLSLLAKAKRGYLVSIGLQMNGCYASGWYDAAAVMMRRLLEVSIIEAFERVGLAARIKNSNGDFVQLSDLIDAALAETSWNLSRNTKKHLPRLRDIGHMSAHGRNFHAQKQDIEKVELGCRVTVEEFLRLAQLL